MTHYDFRLFKESKLHIDPKIQVLTDSGYQGLQKIHLNAQMPKKRSKKKPLSLDDKIKKSKSFKDASME